MWFERISNDDNNFKECDALISRQNVLRVGNQGIKE
jgi:hypothetical protein